MSDDMVFHCPDCGGSGWLYGVMEAGVAAGNGYLWTSATAKAYREGA